MSGAKITLETDRVVETEPEIGDSKQEFFYQSNLGKDLSKISEPSVSLSNILS